MTDEELKVIRHRALQESWMHWDLIQKLCDEALTRGNEARDKIKLPILVIHFDRRTLHLIDETCAQCSELRALASSQEEP